MMKMATGEGSPLRQGAGRAPERFLVATEACGGETPDLSSSLMFLGYVDLYRRKKSVGGASRGPREGRARPGGGRAPHPRGQRGTLLAQLFYSGASFGPEKIIKNWHVNWTPFGIPFL